MKKKRIRADVRLVEAHSKHHLFPDFGFGIRVLGCIWVSEFAPWVAFELRVLRFQWRGSGLGIRDSGFGFWDSAFEIRVSGSGCPLQKLLSPPPPIFRLRALGFGFRDSEFGIRLSGFGFRVLFSRNSRIHPAVRIRALA